MSEDSLRLIPLPLIEWKTPIRDFDAKDIENMAASLRVHGQIEPIVVTPPDERGIHQGICGRLRYEGAKRANIPEILCRVHEFKSESEKKAWQLVENLHRRQLSYMQIAEGYMKLYQLYMDEGAGTTESIIGTILEAFEKLYPCVKPPDEKTIWGYIRASKLLTPEVKDTLPRETSKHHVEQLLRLKDKPEKQVELALSAKQMTAQELKQEVDKIIGEEKPKPIECEFKTFVTELSKALTENIPKTGGSCESCKVQHTCSEYKKAIAELVHEIKQAKMSTLAKRQTEELELRDVWVCSKCGYASRKARHCRKCGGTMLKIALVKS